MVGDGAGDGAGSVGGVIAADDEVAVWMAEGDGIDIEPGDGQRGQSRGKGRSYSWL